MPRCPSCGHDVFVLCAEDELCRDCSDCCRVDVAPVNLIDSRAPDV